jgi:hypothetical protein
VCLIIFLLIRTVVLRRPNSTKIAFWVLPVLIIVTIWVVSVHGIVRHLSYMSAGWTPGL